MSVLQTEDAGSIPAVRSCYALVAQWQRRGVEDADGPGSSPGEGTYVCVYGLGAGAQSRLASLMCGVRLPDGLLAHGPYREVTHSLAVLEILGPRWSATGVVA